MSLNWQCTDTPAWKEIKPLTERTQADLTDQEIRQLESFRHWRDKIVWATVVTGYPKGSWKITESNLDEMHERLNVYFLLIQSSLLTREMIESFVGLSTNAGNMTTAQFNKSMMSIARREAIATVS